MQSFHFKDNMVRVANRDGAPWFVAADVCNALGLLRTSHTLAPLSADEKGRQNLPTLGGDQKMLIISESGLYKLVLRAQRSNPLAREFQDWVTREVLPAIRKDGAYIRGEENARPFMDELGDASLMVRQTTQQQAPPP